MDRNYLKDRAPAFVMAPVEKCDDPRCHCHWIPGHDWIDITTGDDPRGEMVLKNFGTGEIRRISVDEDGLIGGGQGRDGWEVRHAGFALLLIGLIWMFLFGGAALIYWLVR